MNTLQGEEGRQSFLAGAAPKGRFRLHKGGGGDGINRVTCTCMNLEHLHPGLLVGQRDLNLPIT